MEQIRGFGWWWGVGGSFHCEQDCGNAFAVAAGAVEEGRHPMQGQVRIRSRASVELN